MWIKNSAQQQRLSLNNYLILLHIFKGFHPQKYWEASLHIVGLDPFIGYADLKKHKVHQVYCLM